MGKYTRNKNYPHTLCFVTSQLLNGSEINFNP